MKNHKNLSIIELKKLSNKDYEDITKLILEENKSSILASLNNKTIKQYLDNIASSNTVFLFVIKSINKIIGYSIIAKRTDNLISVFSNLKIKILLLLIINFKFITLINLILGYLKIDILFLNKKTKQIIDNNYNLNLLAINRQFQSKGIGTIFLKSIFKKVKTKYITCETIDDKATKFYQLRHKFKLMGSKLRIPKNQKILYKKIIL